MKIILYGLSYESVLVSKTIKKDITILGFTDSFAQLDWFAEYPFIPRNQLSKTEFDYLILVIKNLSISKNIINDMIHQYQIPASKILNYYEEELQLRHVDLVMKKTSEDNYDGMIFGCSHAAYGIEPKLLSGRWLNLAYPHQDMYFNYQTLQYCLQHYYQELKSIRHVIFEMYDYNFFNWDSSQTSKDTLLHYFSGGGTWGKGGGILASHNFEKNRHFTDDFDTIIHKMKLVSNSNIWNTLFESVIYERKEWEEIQQRNIMSSQDILISEKLIGSIVEKKYPETIRENIQIFNDFLDCLKKINPDMQITALLLPRFYKMEKASKSFMKDWKIHFYEVMKTMKDKYSINFIDMKSDSQISENPCFYFDPCHLNFVGSMAVTPLLNSYLTGKT